ncbi:MAG: ABC transporter ATP-binding protein [Acidimicrobiia bacterium]|nr:ABC transporter ATP-binding protein [Acidimicrobiia bacterium]
MRVEIDGITKRFPGVLAVDDVSVTFEPGEVHALLGENGAGKSTLMNLLFGLHEPDSGVLRIDGRDVHFHGPSDAIAAGIGMVHQHFKLVPVFTVAENVMLGVEETIRGFLDRRAARARVAELSERYGLKVDPGAVVEDLPVGIQQRVEIIKALYRDAQCLILDEATAVLTPPEIEDLLEIVAQLRDDGRAIVFISHKLREVMAAADKITVLRRGRVVGSTTPARSSPGELASMMVGRDIDLTVTKAPATPAGAVLELAGVTVLGEHDKPVVDEVTFDVRAGEILAVAGVSGNGQTELVQAITGLRVPAAGTIALNGTDLTHKSVADRFERGLAHVPEDRQRDGLVGPFPVRDNLVLNLWRRRPFARGVRIDRRAIRENADALIEQFDIRTSSIYAASETLSGGNQQKVIIAREFTKQAKLLVLSQPTRGLDVGSIKYIHTRVVEQRDAGCAVLLVSYELDEVLALADRVAVMCEGRVLGVLEGEELTRDRIGLLMAGTVLPQDAA